MKKSANINDKKIDEYYNMKKILILLGTITLIWTSTTSLVSCNIFNKDFNNKIETFKYTEEELKKIKAKNKINTINQETRDNLEWIAPQEKPFDNVDNRYYFVVWREQKEDDWYSTLFIHNSDKARTIDKLLAITKAEEFLDLFAGGRGGGMERVWSRDNGTYFKAVYRWNLNTNIPNLTVDYKTGEIKV
ncbi:hypothetical protein D6D54_07620 [Spiroplasma poulsonii]|uniref:Lipoprotein n=2 Tax=Spiroplasma poulsonii TaxID=2138 RepID=A0A3S0ZVE7_9MOLU|nr:hypothetical protein [Spiroplasma poulsonii]MBW3059348.1 hypothetical protein [Spiroplasma poulsonii]RUP75899.1 hypothetical protein D6D54_07620 [Spiroplasma poulsonii]